MKTTVLIKDELYTRLVEESVRRYGTTKKISVALNEVLERHFGRARKKKSLFGCSPEMKPFERDHGERAY